MAFDNDPLSYSRIARWEQCPKSYALHYIDKVPEAPSAEQRFGTIVRQTLQRLLEEHVAAGKLAPLPVDRAIDLYQEQWTEDGLSPLHLFEEGEAMVREFVAREGLVDPRDVLAIELPFELKTGRFAVVGIINRMDWIDDFTIRVHIYKTGHAVPTRDEVDSDLQLSLQHAAAARIWPWARTIELQLDVLRHGFTLKTSRTPEQIASALRYLQAVGEASESATAYPARLSPACVRCEYRDRCDTYGQALSSKPDLVAAAPDDLLALAREREQVSTRAAILKARQKELDGVLKDRLQDSPRLDLGGIRYQIQNAASVEYPVEPTLAALSEATGLPDEELRARLAVIDNAALQALLKQVAQKLPRPRVTLLKSELESRASKSFTRRLLARPVPAA